MGCGTSRAPGRGPAFPARPVRGPETCVRSRAGRAGRGERFRLGKARFSDDTFRFVKLRVAETYRSRVEEIQSWCDERRMLDLQTRLHHWLYAWLFIHVPFSFLLLILTFWHAYVTLFHY